VCKYFFKICFHFIYIYNPKGIAGYYRRKTYLNIKRVGETLGGAGHVVLLIVVMVS
jgi:hypothetical protein